MRKKEINQVNHVDIFLKRVGPQEETQAGHSGSSPEEGIVIIGEYNPIHVPLKTFQGDKIRR